MTKRSSYWQHREQRERKWQKEQLVNDDRYVKQIRQHYEAAIRRINDDINNQFQWLASQSGQPYAEMQKQVENLDIQRAAQDAQGLVSRANDLRRQGHRVTYGDFTEQENARMRLYNATMRINRMEFLKSEVGIELTKLTGELNSSLGTKLTDDARKEYRRQAGIMGEQLTNVKLWVDFKPQVFVMKSVSGGDWSQRLWKNQDMLKGQLDSVLSAGFITGESNQTMARHLKEVVRSTITNQRFVTERLARTESARVAYDVQRESIERNGFKWVEWFAEPSACSICARIARVDNGQGPGIYPLKKVPKIPEDTHPNCRCSIGSYYSDDMLDEKLKKLGFDSDKDKTDKEVSLEFFKRLNNTDIKTAKANDIIELGKEFNRAYNVTDLVGNKDALKKVFNQYRRMGGHFSENEWVKGSRLASKRKINHALSYYPHDWSQLLKQNNQQMFAGQVKRGFYANALTDGRGWVKSNIEGNPFKDYVSIYLSNSPTVAFHELGHFIEHHNIDVLRIEKEFIANRTKGERPTRLNDIFPMSTYSNREVTKRDNFISPYIGKEYSGATEVLSMGLESLFEPGRGQQFSYKDGKIIYKKITDDPEYLNLIIGLILKG